MNRHIGSLALGLGCVLVVPQAWAAPRAMEDCRSVPDPTARLACYDRLAGHAPAIAPPHSPGAVPEAPDRTVSQHDGRRAAAIPEPAQDLKHRPAFDSRLAAVTPLRHG